MAGNFFNPWHSADSFSTERSDGSECRRLRLALGLNAEKMAMLAGMPGRWAWLSVENGYEPIGSSRWALCLAEIENHSFGCVATPRYHFDDLGISRSSDPRC
ncbi:MAG: hypothetical protein ABI564_16510 [Ideonella sp.]